MFAKLILRAVLSMILAEILVRFTAWLFSPINIHCPDTWQQVITIVLFTILFFTDSFYLYKTKKDGKDNNDLFPGL